MKSVARSLIVFVAVVTALGAVHPRTVHAAGNTSYVDPAGNDGNLGDSTHPFQHINQCAAVMGPGDTCVINSGTYREKVTPQASGTASAPITYEAAPGATVRVDGTDYVNGWSLVSSADVATLAASNSFITGSPFANAVTNQAVYKAHVVVTSPLDANQLFVNDQMQNEAQWPDPGSDPLTPTVELARAGTTPTNIADPALSQPRDYWDGASIYIQDQFTAATGTVTASTPGDLAVTGYYGTYPTHWETCEIANPNEARYYLWGKITELNAPTEWYYDGTTSTLYFVPAGGTAPGLNTVTLKQRPLAFDLTTNVGTLTQPANASNITISGLQIFGATIATGPLSTGVNLTGLQVSYPSHFMTISMDPHQVGSAGCDNLSGGVTTSGLIINGSNNTVQNSTIQHSAGNGVVVTGGNNTVTNNVIHDVDYSGGRPAGVFVIGDGNRVTYNTIYNVGRGGIEANTHFGSGTFKNEDISYNDISSFGRLEQDDGAIYVCCAMDMNNTVIHHNWLHDAQTYPGVPARATIGVYIDGGTQGAPATGETGYVNIYCNVGWDISSGVVGLVTSPVNNAQVLNNDGGVFLSGISSSANSRVTNNIGDVAEVNNTTAGVVPSDHNLTDINAHPPLYVDEAARNYSLQTTPTPSPAYGTGVVISPGTDTYSGTSPNIGAYQPADTWQPGASGQQATVIRPEWGASSVTHDVNDNWTYPSPGTPPIGRMDSHPSRPYADMWPGLTAPDSGTLHLTFATPLNNNNRTIDKVSVLLYARMARNRPTTSGDVVLTMPGFGTVFDAQGKDFESVGVPVSVDITSQVAGNWRNLPLTADLYGTLGVEPQMGDPATGTGYATIDVYAVEIYIQAH